MSETSYWRGIAERLEAQLAEARAELDAAKESCNAAVYQRDIAWAEVERLRSGTTSEGCSIVCEVYLRNAALENAIRAHLDRFDSIDRGAVGNIGLPALRALLVANEPDHAVNAGDQG